MVIGTGPDGKLCKNVSEADALNYVLGYTAGNDVSSRATQFTQSQWCYSKGYDTSCPLGPVLLLAASMPDPRKMHIRGLKNEKVMQDCGIDDLIFDIPKIISFCSSGTTLEPGTVILTGTPSGVGSICRPQEFMKEGDVYAIEVTPGVGTLVNRWVYEK